MSKRSLFLTVSLLFCFFVVISLVFPPATATSEMADTKSSEKYISQTSTSEPTQLSIRSEPEQTITFSSDSDQSFVSGGIYTSIMKLNVSNVGLLEGIATKDEVSSPNLSIGVSTSGGGGAEIVGISTDGEYETPSTANCACYLESDSPFASGSQRTVLVRFYIDRTNPPNNITLRADPTANKPSNGDQTEVTYEVKESVDQQAAMARTAEARAELASGHLITYETIMYQKPWNKTVRKRMSKSFSIVANEAAMSLVTGYADEALSTATSLQNANNLGSLQDAQTSYDMSQGKFGSSTVAKLARVNHKLYNDLLNRIAVDEVQRSGNSSYALQKLQSLSRKEAEAWRNGDKDRVRKILYQKQLVLLGYSNNVDDSFEFRFERNFEEPLGAPSNPGLIRQARSQKASASGETAKLFNYFVTLDKFGTSQLNYIRDTALPLARDPAPTVSLNSSRQSVQRRLSNLERGQSTTIEFEVANQENGGVTSSSGYLSISTPDGLTITDVSQEAGDDAVSVTNYSAGSDEIYYSDTQERRPAVHDLTDIREQYNPGETNTYKLTVENESADTAWITYRTAFEPIIAPNNQRNQSSFIRYPNVDHSVSSDQQGYAAFNISASSDGQDRPPIAQISVSMDSVQTGESITFDGKSSTDDVGIDSYEWQVYNASSGNKLSGPLSGDQQRLAFDSVGMKNITLTVTDTNSQVDVTSKRITATPSSEITPTIKTNRTIIEPGDAVELHTSTVGETYEWDLTGDGTYDDSIGSTTVWEPQEAGTSEIGIRVTTGTGDQYDTRVTYTIENATDQLTTPTPRIEAPETATIGERVVFDARNSTDMTVSNGQLVSGSITNYEWDFNSDNEVDVEGPTVNTSFDDTGVFSVELTLTDQEGLATTTQLPIRITATGSDGDNDSPTARFNYTPNPPVTGTSATFDAANSTDTDGAVSSYEWDFNGDGTIEETGETVTYTYSNTEPHEVTLRVTDNDGQSDSITQTVNPVRNIRSCEPGVNSDTDLRCIEYGETRSSEITSTDIESPVITGFWYEPVTFYGSAGDQVTITLSSSEIDPGIAKLVTPSGGERENPGGLANPVRGPPYEKSGTFTINENGAYEIRIDHGEEYNFGRYEMSIEADTTASAPLSGSGTPDDPYVLTDVDDLKKIENNPNANYKLGNDIDASQTEQNNDGNGLEPIIGADSSFNGTLNGAGHTIDGLHIVRVDQNQMALFNRLGDEGRIQNISFSDLTVAGEYDVAGLVITNRGRIQNLSVSGFVEGYSDVGGVAVVNRGAITNLTSSMQVTVSENDAGGVAAINKATLNNVSSVDSVSESSTTSGQTLSIGGISGRNSGVINRSNSASFVDGDINIGGIVGKNDGTVKLSSATSTISARQNVGGLVGSNAGEIKYAWAGGGDITGDARVGGLVGNNNGEIMNSYAYGDDDGRSSVAGNNNAGGFVGANSGSISASYWDTQTTGQSSSAGSARGLTTDEMTGLTADANMRELAFGTFWDTRMDDYPALTFESDNMGDDGNVPSDVTGDGNAPSDPDGDGVYEDVNGDGEITFADLQGLYAAGLADGGNRITADNEGFFDFNGQDGLTFADLQTLYAEELRA